MGLKLIKKLSEEQQQCIKFTANGDLLIRGVPGCGKTTVLLERAMNLLQDNKNPSNRTVQIITFNKALSVYIRQLGKKLNRDVPIEALTFHQWGMNLLAGCGLSRPAVAGSDRLSLVNFAKNIVNKDNSSAIFPNITGHSNILTSFLADEIHWIKSQGITHREDYMSTPRTGRGTDVHLLKKHRITIYDVLEKYNELLKNKKRIDFDDVALMLVEHAARVPQELLPAHILVDEAQDLTPAQFRALKLLARQSLTIGADKGQQIYRNDFTWKSVGIEIRGRRSKLLTKSFRSTKQIIRLANSLLRYDEQLLKDDEFTPAVEPGTEGPKPELMISEDKNKELQNVVRRAKQLWSTFQEDTIAIIATKNDRLDEFATELKSKGLPYDYANSEDANVISPGIKLTTFHSSKGLEFDHVIVTGLKQGELPSKSMVPGDDQVAFLATERRKLYVAITRAKLTLLLSARMPVSSFVHELDPDLYD